jgi:outer membrane protein OmpA-like peptidoglycan-associated protein
MLGGCTWTPDYLSPAEWFKQANDKLRGTEEVETSSGMPPPVPGIDASFPKLGTVPEAPPGDVIRRDMAVIADDLVTQRTNVLFIDAVTRATDGGGPGPQMVRIGFDRESAEIPVSARKAIAAFATRMLRDQTTRAQLMAYAKTADPVVEPSEAIDVDKDDIDRDKAARADAARRLSLTRAFTVRAALVDHGVAITRVSLRALGGMPDADSADRVDAILVE